MSNSSSFTVRSPEPFTFSNPSEWPKWKRRFERFRIASKLKSATAAEQINTLIYLMGDQADNIFLSLKLTESQKEDYDTVLKAFSEHFVIKTNVIYERAKFNLRYQLEGELIEDFITDLNLLSENCNCGALRDEMIRDRIVVGVRDRKLSEKLQLVTDLTLDKAITEVRQHHAVRKQQQELTSSTIHRLSAANKKNSTNTYQLNRATNRKSETDVKIKSHKCEYCGSTKAHSMSKCPAKGKKCNLCGKWNHFSSVCRSQRKGKQLNMNRVDADDSGKEEQSSLEMDEYFLGMLTNGHENVSWRVNLNVNNTKTYFLIDTGSPVDTISTEVYEKYFRNQKLRPPDLTLRGPEGTKLNICGTFNANIRSKRQEIQTKIYVIDSLKSPLLSLSSSERLGLIQKGDIMNLNADSIKSKRSKVNVDSEFPQIFKGLGCLKRFECEIRLKENAEPYRIACARRVPIALKEKLQKKLDEMVELKVIRKVDEPTPWCAPLVIVSKANGDIRPCVDLTKLNLNVEREIHPMPVADHTLAQLSGAKIFSKLDANSGFWQVKLSKNSQLLTTFLTPFGRYCFLRLPFGISSAPEQFQKYMQEILKNIKGVVCQIDDILIFAPNVESHDKILRKVLERLNEHGVTLNRDKCKFGITSLEFLGHNIDHTGIRPSHSKVKAVKEYPPPKNITELKRFLGMVNFLGKFIPFLSDYCQPLNELLRKHNEFMRQEPQETAFNKLKSMLTTNPVLKIYNPKHKTIISCDASHYGLGSVLLQIDDSGDLRPVAYASRSLSETEKGYAQIEKEALALTWAACEKFPDLLTGITFSIETDHKPLVAIFSTKNLDDLTPRLQRLRMKMMKYAYEIYYTAGKFLVAADALSRHPLEPTKSEENGLENELNTFVNKVIADLPVTELKLKNIIQAQKDDPIVRQIIKYCINGWPDRYQCELEVRQFYNERFQLAVNNDILMYNARIVIPPILRQEILEKIHAGHLGIVKCKARAKQSVWWPRISKAIEDYVKQCSICIQQMIPRHEAFIESERPQRPWQIVGMDLFFHNSHCYLIISDYFSRFPEIARLENQTSECVINHAKSIFSRHGIPEIVKSDNGPQFGKLNFSTFAKFVREWGFQHETSSPKCSQSNGFIESAVKTIKLLLKKNPDPYLALMEYRTSPLSNGLSPAEMLMGRKIRTTLPMNEYQLEPKYDLEKAISRDKELKKRQIHNYIRRHGVRDRDALSPGDVVWIRDISTWGRIERSAETPRSYIIKTSRGTLRRNSFHLVSARSKEMPYIPEEVRDMGSSLNQEGSNHRTEDTTNKPDTTVENTGEGVSNPVPNNYVGTTRYGRVVRKPDRYTAS